VVGDCYIDVMSTDPTQPQRGVERRQSREMSLQRGHPPTQVPGYEPMEFLGVGAYGEVWVAREQNTGRRVAIKFYAHRGGLDWSLLSREVEKLTFLFADRYVVQLLAVGWDADPPYYVMEYLERGSLAERLQSGPLPVGEAMELFRDVAVGLVHAHGKGVLHCDLKPANILLDQDNKPRLADFGQSRLSHEQIPALGTLFYMAPEQADLEAVPDARWDVYALGALLYCMLTGGPPHRSGTVVKEFEKTPHLLKRLERYRQLIEESPPAWAHRQVRGVDRALADIVDRCLAADPKQRFPTVQAVLEALNDRAQRRQRRPMMVLGAVLPALLLLVVTWFAWRGFGVALQLSDAELTLRALQSNRFAAQHVARTAANELDRRYRAVEQVAERLAASEAFRRQLNNLVADGAAQGTLKQIDDLRKQIADLQKQIDKAAGQQKNAPELGDIEKNLRTKKGQLEALCADFRAEKTRQALQREFEALIPEEKRPPEHVASWFFCSAKGTSAARLPEGNTIGKNFAWRSYYHGGKADLDESWRPDRDELEKTWRPQEPGSVRPVEDQSAASKPIGLSAVFPSHATGRWIVAISTAVFDGSPSEGEFLGVVALTVEVGRFAELQGGNHQFAVLVDYREGDNQGVILQHPLFDGLIGGMDLVPAELKELRVDFGEEIPKNMTRYSDPFIEGNLKAMAGVAESKAWRGPWLACVEPVTVRGRDTGLLVIVQESYETAIGSTLDQLKAGLLSRGLVALGLAVVLMAGLWWFATRLNAKY